MKEFEKEIKFRGIIQSKPKRITKIGIGDLLIEEDFEIDEGDLVEIIIKRLK